MYSHDKNKFEHNVYLHLMQTEGWNIDKIDTTNSQVFGVIKRLPIFLLKYVYEKYFIKSTLKIAVLILPVT